MNCVHPKFKWYLRNGCYLIQGFIEAQVKAEVISVVLIQYDCCPYTGKNLDTDTCTSCKDGGGNQRCISELRSTNPQTLGEAWSRLLDLRVPRRDQPFHILTSDLQSYETMHFRCSSPQPVVLCCVNPNKLKFYIISSRTDSPPRSALWS